MRPSYRLLSLTTMIWLSMSACATSSETVPAEYTRWLENLKEEMVERGISEKTINEVYKDNYYKPNQEVVKIDRKQAEFALTSTEYLNRVVNKIRVETKQKKYKELLPILNPFSKKYGV